MTKIQKSEIKKMLETDWIQNKPETQLQAMTIERFYCVKSIVWLENNIVITSSHRK